jgi:hypothetical protein
MTIDWTKPAHILAVHGVQTGKDGDIDADEKIRKLVHKNLKLSHLERDFEVSQYLYEGINDDAQRFYKLIAKAVLSSQPLAGAALSLAIDLVGDVVTAAADTSTAYEIRKGLRQAILRSYEAGHQLVIVSHSLGTIYSLDVVSELIRDANLFVGDNRDTWPVQGLMTMGSPLGLEIGLGPVTVFDRRAVERVAGADFEVFAWHNYFNALDPIVSGSVFGRPVEVVGARGPVERRYGDETGAKQWLLQGHRITSGKQWLLAHVAYWKNPKVGGKIVDILWG